MATATGIMPLATMSFLSTIWLTSGYWKSGSKSMVMLSLSIRAEQAFRGRILHPYNLYPEKAAAAADKNAKSPRHGFASLDLREPEQTLKFGLIPNFSIFFSV